MKPKLKIKCGIDILMAKKWLKVKQISKFRSALLFYLDYLALMGLCIFISHYLSRLLRKACGRKEVSR